MPHPGRPARLRFSAEHWTAFWEHPHPDLAARIVTPDVVVTLPGGGEPVRGVRRLTEALAGLLERVPDLRPVLAEHATDGDVLFVRWTVAALRTSYDGIDRIQLRDGLIRDLRIYCDSELVTALRSPTGISVPAPASPSLERKRA
jgi:hypothetical protein